MAYTYKHGDRPLEGHTIQRGIGRGGFGEVYYAISDGGREVALKYLRDNSDIELRGVSQCMNLKSPHLVSIFDVRQSAEGEYFIIMEHIAGPSLAELLIAEPNGLGKEKAAYLTREIGKGLADLHDRGIVHRDLKPANIFYEDGHIKIGDYGLSKFISVSRHSAQTTSVGTVHYMAPEVGSGNYHRGIDIYALGVMLYEMLLGRVPFEGSSMGEVLMKHLTEQPEVADLPDPFGKVIRKALEKDPKDRYQNVNEMIDDMLEVNDVRESLAGFNPNTITAIPRRPISDPMRTPVPSPNPVPPPPPPAAARAGYGPGNPLDAVQLPPRLERKLHKVSDKIEKRMDQLAGRPHRRRRHAAKAQAMQVQAPANDMTTLQRVVLSFVITAGICLGTGFLAGIISDNPVHGVSTALMIGAVLFGVLVSTRIFDWIGDAAQPGWVQNVVFMGCAGPPMIVASLPLVGDYGGGMFALVIGMMVTMFLCDYTSRVDSGTRGELSFGSAFGMGICGMICCVIAASILDTGNEESFMLSGACAAGGLSLTFQALGWLLPTHWLMPVDRSAAKTSQSATPSADQRSELPHAQYYSPPSMPSPGDSTAGRSVTEAPFAIPMPEGTPITGYASAAAPPGTRSAFARGFWSVFTFLMLGGFVFNVLFATIVDLPNNDERMIHIVLATAAASLMIFGAQKITLRKRRNFWHETLCPFLIAVTMTGIGAGVSGLILNSPKDEGLAFVIGGLVIADILFLVLLASRFGLTARIFGGGGGDNENASEREPFIAGVAIGVFDDEDLSPKVAGSADGGAAES